MCGIVGVTNFQTPCDYERFYSTTKMLIHRGPDDYGLDFGKNFSFGHRRLAIIDAKNGHQPMSRGDFHLIYNGELYNTESIRNELLGLGYQFKGYSDTEVLLNAYIQWREKCLEKLEGIYAFAVFDGNKLFFARDRLGVKPLFYTVKDNDIMIASEIKCILKYYDIHTVNKEGLQEILGMGPSSSCGKTPFKDVFELSPGCYGVFDGTLSIKEYWALKREKLDISYSDATNKVRELLESAIKRQLVSDRRVACFLSGGIDSSIITLVASKLIKNLETFSLSYDDELDLYDDFSVTSDAKYIEEINDGNFIKNKVIVKTDDLISELENAVILRDMPGMADIDTSLLLLCKRIGKSHTVALSGECADEIFGGYPWFYRDDGNTTGFPWLRNIEVRENLLNDEIKEVLNLKQYVENEFSKAKDSVAPEELMNFINIKYFMNQLLCRKDRMSMGASIEVRVPFSDHNLVEFLYNIPNEYKYVNGVEKSILRDAFKDLLPESILKRKKNPYPKIKHPKYESYVRDLLLEAFNDHDSILNKIFSLSKVKEYIDSEEDDLPWYGQLMKKPQMLSYMYQIHLWGKIYKIQLDI